MSDGGAFILSQQFTDNSGAHSFITEKKMFHFMYHCSRLGDYHLTFHTYSQLEVLKVED